MVSPYAVKLKAKTVKNIGEVSGGLYAMATIGSVLGVFLTTFGLILWLPLNMIFFVFATVVLLTVLMLRTDKKVYAILGLVCLALFLWFIKNIKDDRNEFLGTGSRKVIESLYDPVEIKEEEGVRGIYISGGLMGQIYVDDINKTVTGWEYLDLMEDVLVETEAKEVLVLGVGAGILPRKLAENHNIKVEGVDINGKVLETAIEYFHLNPSDNLKLFVEDARVFLKQSTKKYDAIAMDIFRFNNGHIIPPHLTTQEFFSLVQRHLKDDGIFTIMILTTSSKDFYNSELKTISSVFKHVYILGEAPPIVVASNQKVNFSKVIKDKMNKGNIHGGIVYLDDYAPITSF